MKAGIFLTEEGKEIIELETEIVMEDVAIDSIKKRKRLRSDNFRVIKVKAKAIPAKIEGKRYSPGKLELII